MAVDNKQIAQSVLDLVGGASNVTIATNCMTRLRLTLVDRDKADVESIKKVKGVLGAQWAGTQLQVIIGQNVPKVLDEFIAISGVKRGGAVQENLDAPKEKLTPKLVGNKILDYLSGSMTQLIPLLMAGGLFRTIAVILGPQMLNLVAETDPTYTFFYTTLYEATFYFLPIYLGYAAAKKIGATPVLGMLAGGVVMAPSIITAAASSRALRERLRHPDCCGPTTRRRSFRSCLPSRFSTSSRSSSRRSCPTCSPRSSPRSAPWS